MLRRIPWRLGLVAVVLLCWLAAEALDLGTVSQTSGYLLATSLLLAVGLYGSTFGIDLAQARQHRRIIVLAVTVGVILKAAIIGGTLYLATRDPLYLLLGVVVAQIDPLSVAAVLGDERMSAKTKTILAAWASFDDPLTVILTVYAVAFATGTFGLVSTSGAPAGDVLSGLAGYAVVLLANLALAGAAIAAWHWLKDRSTALLTVVLIVLAAIAVWQFLVLGVAIAGLIVRPAWLSRVIDRVTFVALFFAAGLLGILLVGGVSIVAGAMLGIMAFAAQIVVGILMTRGLPRADRLHLALAQQNGITAIILALRLETDYRGVAAVVAPAILVTNTIHYLANRLADGAARQPGRSRRPGLQE